MEVLSDIDCSDVWVSIISAIHISLEKYLYVVVPAILESILSLAFNLNFFV